MNHHQEYLATINAAIAKPDHTWTLLDLACGEMTMSRHLKPATSLHIDLVDYPARPREFNFKRSDLFESLKSMPDKSYDVCLCCDVVEHFLPETGLKLITEAERVAHTPIFFTPLGSMWVVAESHDPNAHKSAWYPADFVKLGWQVKVYENWHADWGFGAFFAWKT